MKNLISMLVLCAFVSTASTVKAQDKTTSTDLPVISPLRKSQEAPYTGVLMSPTAAAFVITEIQSFPERIKIEVDAAKSDAAAKCKFATSEITTACDADKAALNATLQENKKRIELLSEQLKKAEENAPNTSLWFGAGVVSGVIATVATVFAINAAK